MKYIKKPSCQWILEYPHKILSFTGWSKSNFHYEYYDELITEKEFIKRANKSVQEVDGKIIMPK